MRKLTKNIMGRIEIRDIDEKELEALDEQRLKCGIKTRADYIRLLINMDIILNMVELIKNNGNYNDYKQKIETLELENKQLSNVVEFIKNSDYKQKIEMLESENERLRNEIKKLKNIKD